MKAETDYSNYTEYACPYDTANPAWYCKDHRLHGKALKADYKLKRDAQGRCLESAEEYWYRVYLEITKVKDSTNDSISSM